MQIISESLINGAEKAQGTTIIFDIFRASNTIIAALSSKAKSVIPVGGLKEAYRLKQKYPYHLLFGERHGLPPEGFDGGNSPFETAKMNLEQKEIILTTSAGSKGIVAAQNTDEIIIGGFTNASAVVNYLKTKKPKIITLVAMGLDGVKKAEEDEECKKYYTALLSNTRPDIHKSMKIIQNSLGAKRLRNLKQDLDLEFSLEIDTHPIIPKFFPKSGVIKRLK